MKRIIKILVLVVVVGIFGWTLFYLYNKSKPKPVVYETQTARVMDIIKKTVATGSVVPRKEIEIKPQVSGIIEELYVEPGKIVRKGDLIAKVKIIPNMISLNEAESRVKRANISYEDAKQDYNRNKALFEQRVIAEADYQKFRISLENAREAVDAAEDNLQLIREGITRKSGNITNTLIRSTIEGMVLTVPVEIGNSVIESNTFNAGTTIATVADMGEMIFKGDVDESEVGKLHEGMDLILSVGALDTVRFEAKLEHISPKGVEENGAIQFEIKAAVQLKKDQFIRSGYSANADIVLTRKDQVLSIPESLITFKGDTAYVEIETKPQVFEKKEIKTGLSDGINIEVISGLTEKDKIKVQTKTEMPK